MAVEGPGYELLSVPEHEVTDLSLFNPGEELFLGLYVLMVLAGFVLTLISI